MRHIVLKKLAARLSPRWQSELKRIYYGRQIRKGTFRTTEPEYEIVQQFIKPGDWVLDIGANVGHYTRRFSELVGIHGRVIAFEPVPTTFALLSANVLLFPYSNVTLINAAVSDRLDVLGMSVPLSATDLLNYYQAHLSVDTESPLSVLTVSLDSLGIRQRIALAKIDAEGHESFILRGMRQLIVEHRPTLIVETGSREATESVLALGYMRRKLENSPNTLFIPEVGR